ncbi:MAG: hypothetical protein IKO84_05790 [Butyrivibrio sp.]|nr:hypothetical protein [Butyrivibrio sp.]
MKHLCFFWKMMMNFETVEKNIEQLNKINVNANYASRDRYNALYNSIYEDLLELESAGEIVLEPGKKGLANLQGGRGCQE